MANHANQNPGNPPDEPLPIENTAPNPPPPVVVNRDQVGTDVQSQQQENQLKKKWLYAFIVVPVILLAVAVGGLLCFKHFKKQEENGAGPRTNQPSRKFSLRAAVDGKPLISVDMMVEKEEKCEGEEAGKKSTKDRKDAGHDVVLKSVSELEKESSIAFKTNFEDLLSGSMPIKDLSEKLEKHITKDNAFQTKTDGRLDNIEKGIKNIEDTVCEMKDKGEKEE